MKKINIQKSSKTVMQRIEIILYRWIFSINKTMLTTISIVVAKTVRSILIVWNIGKLNIRQIQIPQKLDISNNL